MAATTVEDIRGWLREGRRQGATHVIVACDTFEWEDYPVFVQQGEDPREKAKKYGKLDARGLPTLANASMQKVMEVYALDRDWESQLAEPRAFHFD